MKKINDLTIVVDVDGVLLTSVGAGTTARPIFVSDDPTLVLAAKKAAAMGTKVEFLPHTPLISAGWDTPLGILAAMLAVAPGRCYIKEAPLVLIESLTSVLGEPKAGAIY